MRNRRTSYLHISHPPRPGWSEVERNIYFIFRSESLGEPYSILKYEGILWVVWCYCTLDSVTAYCSPESGLGVEVLFRWDVSSFAFESGGAAAAAASSCDVHFDAVSNVGDAAM